MQLTKNFSLSELVHPDIIKKIGDRSQDFLNPQLSPTLEAIRERFGTIIVNGNYRGKVFTNSGLRIPDGTVGAKLSSHRFGTAADCKFFGATPEDVQDYILKNQSAFTHVSRMENAKVTVTWLHIEVCTKPRNGTIHVFNP